MNLHRFFCFLAILLFGCTIMVSPLWAADRVMKLTIPTCDACGGKFKVRAVLTKIEGVKSHIIGENNTVTIVFDDQKITAREIVTSLEEADLPPTGNPIMIK